MPKLEIDNELVELIQEATQKALCDLFENHKETYYYCSLITTGEGLCPLISAWSYAETPYFAYGEQYFDEVKRVFSERVKRCITEEEVDREIQLRINSMEKAMNNLDYSGLFGIGQERLGILVNAEFMPPDYTNTYRGLRLNPKEALVEWLDEIAEEID